MRRPTFDMAPSGPAYNVDWVWSDNSNVHAANDRDWFQTYTPFQTYLCGFFSDTPEAQVLGVSDAELETRRTTSSAAHRYGRDARKVVLRDVLYVPNYPCNVLGAPIKQDYLVCPDFADK